MKVFKLSFIVPCYNVEKYVRQCLDSILACSLAEDEYEVLCIDDCSLDNSSTIVHSYADTHSNVRVITHSENKGLGGARNTGIREAKGKYIWFVDSDDFVSSGSIPEVVRACEDNNLDVMAFNYRETDENGIPTVESTIFSQTCVYDGVSFIKKVFGNSIVYHLGYVIRFIYRTEYIRSHNLYFPEKVFWEDTVYMPESLLLASRIQAVPYVCYNYRRNSSSVSGKFHRQYPGELIAQMCFSSGGALLSFASTISDTALSKAFHNKAMHMINQFPLFLLRTGHKQRQSFFYHYQDYLNSAIEDALSAKSKIILTPIIGEIIIACVRPLYIVKRAVKTHRKTA